VKTRRENDERTSVAEDDEQSLASEVNEPTRAAVEARVSEDGDEVNSLRENASRGPSVIERVWLVAAAAFLIAAAILLLRSHTDAAFVTAALGVCAWFLNYREGLKRKHNLQKRGPRNWGPRRDDGE
jgi:Flp pilus assembly protein TadB